MKKGAQDFIASQITDRRPYKGVCDFEVLIYPKDRRADVDGLSSFFIKCCLDALVSVGVLENDSQKFVRSVYAVVMEPSDNPRYEVYLSPFRPEENTCAQDSSGVR